MFALADCNNFFASCEMVFNPKLKDQPVVILSNNDGCIIARSQKAKELGIKMGEPIFHYKGRADIIRLSSNFELYSDMSHRVMQILASASPNIEIYSIDEAFFTLETEDEARSVREKVKKWTGIPLSIGLAPTKTLAKLASEMAKKHNGVFHLNEKMDQVLSEIEISEIWGIGRASVSRLKKQGIYSVLQLKETEDAWIRSVLGVNGYRTVLELRGKSCFEINEISEKKKSIVCSRSFGHKVADLEALYEAIATFAARAGEKLRGQGSRAGFLSIFLSGRENIATCHATLPNKTNETPELIRVAKMCVKRTFRAAEEYRKAGVLLGDFEDGIQPDFLVPPSKDRSKAMEVLDEINARYDKPMIRFAAEGTLQSWKSRRDFTTPKFTTRWTDLLKVR